MRVRNVLDEVDRWLVKVIFVVWILLTASLIADGVIVPHPVEIPTNSPFAQGWFVVAYGVSILTVPGSLFTIGWRSPRFPWRPLPGVAVAIAIPIAIGLAIYVIYRIWPVRFA